MQFENFEKRGGIFFQQLLAQAVVAGFEDFADVLGHVFANAGKFAQLGGFLGDIFDALGHGEEQLGDFLVGAVAADDGAVDFKQLRCFAQDFGYFAVFHGGGSAPEDSSHSGFGVFRR